jgi:hypothetical protein
VPTVSDGKRQLGGFVHRIAPLVPDQVASLIAIPLPSLPYGLRLSSASAQSDTAPERRGITCGCPLAGRWSRTPIRS